ncbi:MAG: twin transmembrane helix small protein [Hyphomicrobium zavarzinii]|uniref:twin transmembrane helix small protein n=1 Tax=Hyphomicrobium TaxID=81 RepID=UPI0003A743B9|nr:MULTISPECIES: twin transmembrane helix small protein [Hyphomicrobium]MBL8844480.1 twin transmembrane helix small protein [Hyphomicrobium zavarzinii]WBT38724.1 twin transmembrane helix small protein [Hyphomicrobium sp. DMF-1]HML41863.1 twin transmembrane helix small protein [Hyphomicrobium zavarzinii]
MQSAMYYLSTGAVFAVLIVLLMGLWVMTRGRSPNLSQKLMRWRVGLQFAAIVMIVAYVYVKQHM